MKRVLAQKIFRVLTVACSDTGHILVHRIKVTQEASKVKNHKGQPYIAMLPTDFLPTYYTLFRVVAQK